MSVTGQGHVQGRYFGNVRLYSNIYRVCLEPSQRSWLQWELKVVTYRGADFLLAPSKLLCIPRFCQAPTLRRQPPLALNPGNVTLTCACMRFQICCLVIPLHPDTGPSGTTIFRGPRRPASNTHSEATPTTYCNV